jgi:hypothetical protein
LLGVASADRAGTVDAQHLRTHVGQHHGGERAWTDPGNLEDLHPV